MNNSISQHTVSRVNDPRVGSVSAFLAGAVVYPQFVEFFVSPSFKRFLKLGSIEQDLERLVGVSAEVVQRVELALIHADNTVTETFMASVLTVLNVFQSI